MNGQQSLDVSIKASDKVFGEGLDEADQAASGTVSDEGLDGDQSGADKMINSCC